VLSGFVFAILQCLDANLVAKYGVDSVVLAFIDRWVPIFVIHYVMDVGFRVLALIMACCPFLGLPHLSPELNAMRFVFWFLDQIIVLNLARSRNMLGRLHWLYPPLPDVHSEPIILDGKTKGYYLHVTQDPDAGLLLYYYGGAFIGGDAPSCVGFLGRMGIECNCNVFLPNHRRAPEFGIADILQDAVDAYQWVLTTRSSTRVIFGGPSSGGFLALLMLSRIRELGLPMPAGVFTFSAWVDFTASLPSITHSKDPFMSDRLVAFVKTFTNVVIPDGRLPFWSPINRSCEGFPPLFMAYGDTECCADENSMFADKARQAGAQVMEMVVKDGFHAFAVFQLWCPEALRVHCHLSQWVERVLRGGCFPAAVDR